MNGANRRRVVIVGGGITGLAAAHRLIELQRQRNADFEVLVLEAQNRLGGVMGSERRDGFVLERGPDSFISEKPWALKLSERLGLEAHLVRTNDEYRRNFVVHDGVLHPLPDGFLMMAPTRFLPLLKTRLFSWPGKLRMGLDLLLPRGGDTSDESLASFVTRRLGKEALDRVAQPLVGGIYTADPDRLSLAATMPRFLEMEKRDRSVIWSMWRKAKESASAAPVSGARWSLFVSFDGGMQTLLDALIARLPEGSVRLNSGVRSIERAQRWRVVTAGGESIDADALVLATPAYASATLLEAIDETIAAELRGIPYASSAVISLAFRREQVPDALDGFGFVVPKIENRSIIACTYTSVKYPHRAPEGHVLLRAFVGGALQAKLADQDDAALVGSVRRELQQLLGISSVPLFTDIHRHPATMPQYHIGHLDRVQRIETKVAKLSGLQLAGNGYRGVGVPDCIHSGERAAEALVESLT